MFFEFVGILKEDGKIKGDFMLWWNGENVGLKDLALDSHTIVVLNFGLRNFALKVYVEKLNHGLANVANVVEDEGLWSLNVLVVGLLIVTLIKVVLKVILMEIMGVFFLKIVKMREELQLMMVLITMNLWFT